MNKQTISSIIKIANKLDNSGYYKEANMLTKLAYDVSPDDIIMPGDQKPEIQQDYSNVDLILENLKSQILTIINTANSLPELLENEEGPDDSMFYYHRRDLIQNLQESGNKISSLLVENMDFDSARDLDDKLEQ
jgi:hypothetical protein